MSAFVLATLAAALLGLVAALVEAAARRFRGTRLIVCPETGAAAAVELDAARAVRTAAASMRELRIAGCSRWPEREHCDQACLHEVESAPEDAW